MASWADATPASRFDAYRRHRRYTVGNYESAMHTLLEGALLAVIVVFIFLRDWRATLIVSAVALPLSIIPAFWACTCWASRSTSSACSPSRW